MTTRSLENWRDMALPIKVIQILWINLITATTLGMALAFEPAEADTIKRPPRPRNEALLTGALVWQIVPASILFLCGVMTLYFHAINRGLSLELARTIAMNALVLMEVVYLLFIRNIHTTSLTWDALRGTLALWLTILIVAIGQFAITWLPFMQASDGLKQVP